MLDYKNPNLIVQSDEIEPGSVAWQSPANLAILKYWGKHGTQLPRNPSFSLTLNSALTQTQIEYAPKESGDRTISLEFLFAGEPNEAFRERVLKYLEGVADIFPFLRQLDLTIRTGNSFPHSAGIASSASAMSALALCLCSMEANLFGTLDEDEEFERKASYVARLGSGSACRSIFSHGALWGETSDVPGSSDLFAAPMQERMHEVFKTFHDDIMLASTEAKSVSSRAGHSLMENHPFADSRYQDARRRLHFLLGALKSGDVEEFGRIAENEALTLHGLMLSSNPSFILLKSNTLQMIGKLRQYREETKYPLFFSLDAGPNLHVLYPEDVMPEVREFITDELIPLCEEEQWLQDWVGEGPVEV